MAEDTKMSAAADDLTKAAAAAVAEQESEPTENAPPEPPAEAVETAATPEAGATEPAVDDEGLPVDHKERSELGRKLAAMHRRNDAIEDQLLRLASMMEKIATPKTPETPEPQFDPNEPVTYNEMLKILEHREVQKQRSQSEYQDKYASAIERMVAEYTDDEGKPNITEINGVLDEMKALTYHPSADAEKDAIFNLRKAERAYLRKKYAVSITTQKQNPIRGEKPKSPLGTTTGGHVPSVSQRPVKLDAAAEAYLSYVSAKDGADRAAKLRVGIPANED